MTLQSVYNVLKNLSEKGEIFFIGKVGNEIRVESNIELEPYIPVTQKADNPLGFKNAYKIIFGGEK